MLRSIRTLRIVPLLLAAVAMLSTARSLSARPIPPFGSGDVVSNTPDTGSEAMSQLLKQQLSGTAAPPNCAGQLGLANLIGLGSLSLIGLSAMKRRIHRR
jgi:hypothetical protein